MVIQKAGGPWSLYCTKCHRWFPNTANTEMKKEGFIAHSHDCDVKAPEEVSDEEWAVRQKDESDAAKRPIGCIEYLDNNGMLVRSVPYEDPDAFIAEIKECNFYGVPIGVVLYRGRNGNLIPRDFVADLNPKIHFRAEDITE